MNKTAMQKLTQVLSVRVTFELPNWFADERHEYMVRRRYPAGHLWAGQEQSREYENRQVDALFRLSGVKEICHDPMAKWVEVEFSGHPKLIPAKIARFEAKLQRFLARYREAKQTPKPSGLRA
jgi:hypothetical protein